MLFANVFFTKKVIANILGQVSNGLLHGFNSMCLKCVLGRKMDKAKYKRTHTIKVLFANVFFVKGNCNALLGQFNWF